MNLYALLLSLAVVPTLSAESATPELHEVVRPDDTVRRGSVVYHHYCANCHGVEGDGKGRAAKLYDPKPANLQKSRVGDAYKQLIILQGGARLGRSEFMPPWEQELTVVETEDVIAYLRTIVK